MRADQFDYYLPPSLIAKEPVSPRDACRLMVLDRQAYQARRPSISDHHFYDLEKFLHKGDVLVFNDSKVLPARILFSVYEKPVEVFLLRQLNDQDWTALVKPGKVFKKGEKFDINRILKVEVLDVFSDGSRKVRFSFIDAFDRKWYDVDRNAAFHHDQGAALLHELEKAGSVPLPPYIKNSKASFEDYQTVYAKEKGSVAAPTAGLHFTPRLLKKLEAKGIQLEFVTLHVGAGTFLPLKTETIEHHEMHSEFYELTAATARHLNRAREGHRRIIAVGTTSVRVLESSFDPRNGFQSGIGETAIYIYPGYQWKCVNGLITNFHLPKSTLILLTCAFGGKDLVMQAYDEAIRKRYRFYSFGDAMLLL